MKFRVSVVHTRALIASKAYPNPKPLTLNPQQRGAFLPTIAAARRLRAGEVGCDLSASQPDAVSGCFGGLEV